MFDPTNYELIDLSIGLESNANSEPWPPEIERYDHEQGAELLAQNLRDNGYDVEAANFPDGIGLGWEQITAITHTGTHMDAPSHYGPTVDGEKARTIDDVPLEWTRGYAVVLDFTWKEPGSEITPLDLEDQLSEINHELSPGELVFIETGADELWGSPEYLTQFPGMGKDATEFLIERGIRVIGTDAYGFDKPFTEMGARYVESGDESELWPAHFTGRDAEYCQIEKMANLDKLPRRTEIPVLAQPIKIEDASGAWVRPLAFIEK